MIWIVWAFCGRMESPTTYCMQHMSKGATEPQCVSSLIELLLSSIMAVRLVSSCTAC